jgi:hypothetical protein
MRRRARCATIRHLTVAYFVQSHRLPGQVLRLLSALRAGSPDALLVVGHCPVAEPLDAAQLSRLGVHAFLHRRRCSRGSWTLLEPYFDAVELLADRGLAYDWLVYVSGQDYPVQPLACSEAYLRTGACDGYLSWRDAWLPSPEGRRRQGKLRYGYRYRELPRLAPLLRLLRPLNRVQSLWHVQLTYAPRLGVRAFRSPFRDGFRAWVGLQWTTLSRPCAEAVAAAGRSDQALRRHFERTLCPDEAFAQTVLVNDGRFTLCNDALRYVDFAGSRDGHPRVLRLADGPALVGGAFHFARKFDVEVDAAVLDWLDRRLLALPAASA